MTVAGSPGAVAALGALETDQLGGEVIWETTPHRNFTQAWAQRQPLWLGPLLRIGNKCTRLSSHPLLMPQAG